MAKGALRSAAAQCLFEVLEQGQSLSNVLPKYQQLQQNTKDQALLAELCFGVLRQLSGLEEAANGLMKKPFAGKKRRLQLLVLVGLYQLLYTRIPDHAAIAETVAAAPKIGGTPFKGVINGVLRSAQRQLEALKSKVDKHSNHPIWLCQQLKKDHRPVWREILAQNQLKPPMWIRVNQQQHSLDAYRQCLADLGIASHLCDKTPQGLLLENPVDVSALPEFDQGACAVQDGAAQMAAGILDAQPGDWVLDACAAPGGKTCHVLETQPALGKMYALEVDPERAKQIGENLQRLKLSAEVLVGDASQPQDWDPGVQFDRILLDAPCSATGVIRRHADIKWLRRHEDIAQLADLQRNILNAMWKLLKPGGTLVYATCSVLAAENREQIQQFLAQQEDAQHIPLHDEDTPAQPGWQIYPGTDDMDGFYYAKLKKQ